ncbi:hypothetical protein BG004_008292 [Podila humilis]|nr:hypothetical protein BG004_008292 [Podila humilis]
MKITATLLSLAAAATMVSAGKFVPSEAKNTRTVEGAFIVEYEDGVNHAKANSFFNSRKVDYKVRGEFNVFNGASINVKSKHSGEELAKIPGVKRVWPVEIFTVGKPKAEKADPIKALLTEAHAMTGADYVQKTYKYTGKGVKVGIVDSGVDYSHPALGGCFGKGCRVRYGWDFVGDDVENAKSDSDPMDQCNGHGTHVAGIVGADARKVNAPHAFVGVAPEVTFGAYRVLDCNGSGSNEGVMWGMELAFNQGMDVINMSLGGGASYKSNPVAALADKLTAKGMAVIAAAGNDGTSGVGMVGDSSLGDLTTAVASFDNVSGFYNYVKYAGGEYPYTVSNEWGKTSITMNSVNGTIFPLRQEDGTLLDGCNPDSYTDQVKGKVVFVLGDFTGCDSYDRGELASNAGATGMIIQSTPFGLNGVDGYDPTFPMASVESGAGEAILAAQKKSPRTRVGWSTKQKNFKIEGGGSPSTFSSLGLDGELRIKPDVAAPGGNIYSTYPTKMGSYAVLSGTSMATPYLTGAQALLYNAHKRILKGEDARRILKSTATPGKNYKHKHLASVAKQGGGLVNIKNAIAVKTLVSPEHIQLSDTPHFAGKTIQLKLKNLGKKTITYTLTHEASESLISYRGGNTFPLLEPVVQADFARVKFSSNKITVKPGQLGRVKVSFAQPKSGKAEEFPLYSGYIVATPSGKGEIPVRVPYAGIKGDVAKIPIMDTEFGVPVALVNGLLMDKGQKIEADNRIHLVFRLGSHSPDVRMMLVDTDSGKTAGYLSLETGPAFGPYGRNANMNIYGFAFDYHMIQWNLGEVFVDKTATKPITVPAGNYKIVVASQHKLSKGNYPADFEIIDFAEFTL